MNKAHGHDDIFVRMMIKTCDSMVTEPQFFLKKTVLNAEPLM